MTTTTVDPEVEAYLAAVRRHLADLPDDERDELLEDLESHLREVAAESDGPLTERLGAPDDYAADLRASAGLPPVDAATAAGTNVARVRRHWTRLAAHPTTRRVRAFLPELRPGWWVLRGMLLVWVLAMTNDVDASDIPFPPLFGSRFVGFVAMIVAVPLSVRLGRRQQGDRRLTRTVHIGEAVLLVLTVPLLASLADRETVWIDRSPSEPFEVYGGVLMGPDGRPITNFYATDENGQAIEHFRLYDQNGMPVTNVAEIDDFSNPDGMVRSQIPVDRDGRPVPNGFPRDTWLERYDGSTATLTPPLDATTVAPPTTAAPTTSATPAAPTTTVAPDAPAAPHTTATPDPNAAPDTTAAPVTTAAPATTVPERGSAP
jgi:hypothetical protein